MFNKLLLDFIFSITSIVLLFFIGLVLKKKNQFTKTAICLMFSGFMIVATCGIALNLTNPNALKFVYSLYFISFDFIVFFFLKYFCLVIESYSEVKSSVKKIDYLFPVICVDSLSLFLNYFFNHSFEVVLRDTPDMFTFVTYNFKLPYQFHLFLTYIIVIFIFVILIREIVRAPVFFRIQYVYILLELILIVLLNLFFLIFEFRFDVSVFFYGILGFQIIYFSIYFIPKIITIQMLSVVSENMNSGIATFDIYGNCIQLNDFGHRIFGKGFIGIEKATKYHKYIQNHSFSSKNDIVRTNEIQRIDDKDHYLSFEYQALRDEKGRKLGSYIKINDNTKAILDIQNEHYKSTHDTLTGLYNREGFFEHVEKIINASPKVERYMICTNIPNFKVINDLFGKEFGDELLKKQAEALSYAKYDGTVHGRIFADHFAMLISKENYNPVLAEQNTKKIFEINDKLNYNFNIKIGIYEIANPYESPATMFDKAYLALQQIQSDKEKMIIYYDTTLTEKLKQEKSIIDDLRHSIDENLFQIVLQPQIDSKTEKVIGAEALVRWNHEKYGLLQPKNFIAVLESKNKIFNLDFYVWEKTVKILSEWKKKGFENLYISVNISAKDFYFNDLFSVFKNLVEKYDVSPENLKLEITETILMHDINYHKRILKELSDYGFTIEMDDFGCGYSSLNTLKNLNMNVLKIDMEFLRKSHDEERSKKIIGYIISLAHSFGMTVISEGVETDEHIEILKQLDCDIFQGYYYSKPISQNEFEKKYLKIEESDNNV